MTRRIAIAAVLLAVTALASSPAPRETGDQVAGRLFASLMTTLQEKIAAEGPEAAIPYCRLEALPLTARIAEDFPSVKSVRRTALRVRNPANTPDATDRSVLEKWLAAWNPASPPGPVLVEFAAPDGTQELRYYRPVPVMATCLACHGSGDEISPAVGAALQRAYPDDDATGFAEGDLRGAIVVSFPAPPTGVPKTE
jgi:mono/diheme cytochrome c family protein